HRPDLRSRIPRRRELLPARPRRVAAEHPALARPDVHAEDPWFAPASLEASMSANCLLDYQIPVPDSRFPRTFSVAYLRNMSGSGPRYTTAPSPSLRASHHRLPASLSSGR